MSAPYISDRVFENAVSRGPTFASSLWDVTAECVPHCSPMDLKFALGNFAVLGSCAVQRAIAIPSFDVGALRLRLYARCIGPILAVLTNDNTVKTVSKAIVDDNVLAQQVKNIWMSAAGCFGTLLEMSVAASPSTQVKGKGFFAEWRARREVQAAASPFGEAQDPVRLAAVFEALSGQFDVSSWLPCAVLLISLYQSQSFTAAFALAHLGPKLVPALWRLCYAMAPLFVLPNVPAAMMEAAHVCWSLFGAAMTCTLAVVDDDEFLAGVPFTLQTTRTIVQTSNTILFSVIVEQTLPAPSSEPSVGRFHCPA